MKSIAIKPISTMILPINQGRHHIRWAVRSDSYMRRYARWPDQRVLSVIREGESSGADKSYCLDHSRFTWSLTSQHTSPVTRGRDNHFPCWHSLPGRCHVTEISQQSHHELPAANEPFPMLAQQPQLLSQNYDITVRVGFLTELSQKDSSRFMTR